MLEIEHAQRGEDRTVVATAPTTGRAPRSETQRLREELVATVSHELRTPLASIIGYSELLADLGDEHLSPTARGMLVVIAKNAAREHKLVNDLLATSHERLTDRLFIAPMDLSEIVSAAAMDAASRAAAGGTPAELTVDVAAPGRVGVLADADRIADVADALLDNAVKFSPEGGTIRLDVRREGHHGVLVVRDRGMGMDADEVELAYERLYRAPRAVQAQLRGAGLGLTLVRDIVTAHGGVVELESRVGVGTTVTVRLPVCGP